MKGRSLVWAAALWLAPAVSVHCQGQGTQTPIPRFEDYPVITVFHGKPAEPVFVRGRGAFRTRIREGARKGPNFAGRYTIVKWGCGSGCISFAVVSAISGQPYYPVPFAALGIPFQGTVSGRSYKGLEYRLNSSLLIADGCPEDADSTDANFEKNCGTRYYNWERNRFVLIRSVAVPVASLKR